MRVCQFRHFGMNDAPDQRRRSATGNTYLFYGVWRMCQTPEAEAGGESGFAMAYYGSLPPVTCRAAADPFSADGPAAPLRDAS